MIAAFALALAMILPACPAEQLDPSTHHRWALKTRPQGWQDITAITVADMLQWAVPRAARSDEPIDPKETTEYALTGYIRLIKFSADDCDIHIQLSDSQTAAGNQVIVEVPFVHAAARAALAGLVGYIGSTPMRFSGANAPRIRVVGYGFVDQEHATKDGKKAGHAHGDANVATLWELHPIWTVEPVK